MAHVCCVAAVIEDVFYLGVLKYFVCLCMGSVIVSPCRCFVPCVQPVVVFNAALYMTCSLLLMLVDHMEEAYSRAGLTTAL